MMIELSCDIYSKMIWVQYVILVLQLELEFQIDLKT